MVACTRAPRGQKSLFSTLYPIPYTLHPTPYTLHPTPLYEQMGVSPRRCWEDVNAVRGATDLACLPMAVMMVRIL